MKLLTGWRPYVLAAVVLCLALAAFWFFRATDDRFGDPGRLDQINSSTDCDELHRISDDALAAQQTEAAGSRPFDQQVGYFNAANDRLRKLNCP